MAWYVLLLIQIGLQVLSGLLSNRNAKPEKQLDLPQIDASTPIPVPFGRVLIKDAMLLDYMDFKTEAIKIRNPATFFITTTTVGYRYYIGMVFGLCWGYVAHEDKTRLLEILIDNRSAWTPSVVPPDGDGNGILNGADDPIVINRPTFFGSEKQEGGVRAVGYFYTGQDLTTPSASSQAVNSYWQTQRGVSLPNYKDICYFVWHGPGFGNLPAPNGGKKSGLIGNAPRLWPLAFKLSRFPRLLTEGVLSNEMSDVPYLDNPPIDSYVHANPIEALYEALTSTQWGAGISTAHIYGGLGGGTDKQFADAAVKAYFEGLAFSYLWTSASPVEDMIVEILRYVDGAIWTDPADGLIKIKLARDDYNLATIPSLSNADLIEIESFTRGSWRETKNEVRISFPDQSKTDFEMNTATWRSPANFQIQGANEPAEITFRGCPSLRLANRLAAREGKAVSTPLARLRGKVDRKAWQLHPCAVFKFSWPEEGISNLVMRVTTLDLGTLIDGTITIQCVQDVFAAGAATYAPTSSTIWTDPLGGNALDAVNASVGEIPYWFQRDDVPRVFGVAGKPDSTHVSYDGLLNSTDTESGDFTPTGTLAAALHQVSGTDYNTAGFNVAGVSVDADLIEAGTATTIATQGAGLALIGDAGGNHEWISFESVTDNGSGSVTLDNVWRGLLDTPPRAWASGSRVWFFAAGSCLFGTPLTNGQAITFEALTRTMRDQLTATEATNRNYTTQGRALRPLPPFYVRMGGSYTNEIQASGDLVFTWREHSRLTALELFKQSATTEAAEAGVTYEIDIYGQDDVTLLRVVTGLTSPTYTYTNANELSDSGSASLQIQLRVEFFSKRNGLRSLLPFIRRVYRSELSTIVSQSAVSGSLSVNYALSGTAASESIVSGGMASQIALAGSSDSVSIVSASLTNDNGLTLMLWLAPHMESFADDDAVGTLTDQSGNARHFTQATAANKPTFKTNILNSKPAVRFDGSNDFLEASAFMTGDAEMFAVLKIPTGIGSSNWGWQKFSGATLADHFTFFGTAYSSFGGTNRTNYSVNSATAEAGLIVHIVAKGGASLWKWYENGNVEKATMTQTIDWGTSRHLVGASSGNSDASSISNYFNGWLLELRIYSGTLNSTQRNNVLTELNSTFGISYTSF